MQIVTVRINNPMALKLLEDLEAVNLIEIIKKTNTKNNAIKLSERLAGSISPEQAEAMRRELNDMR